jgi:Ni/Fe-hydrogenase subunit HybB-like protein/Fe-S-cluster-containing dehydrogenase component
MDSDRRQFLQAVGGALAAGAGLSAASAAEAAAGGPDTSQSMGVLVDLCNCVGCRLCEYACKQANGIDPGPLESYDDTSVFARPRRPEPDAFTIVNRWPGREDDGDSAPVYAKVNCMHCNHASCVSACIVGALRKQPNGAVTYDAWKCIGCRYCMVACPFQIPAYEYDDPLTPRVRKCEFCVERTGSGAPPACVEACPRQAMTFGKRSELLHLAHQRIDDRPGRYVDHVYGEHEVGGTSWMYLSPVPFEQAGFLKLGSAAPGALTEAIQHGVFKYWAAPIGWFSFLSLMMWWTRHRKDNPQALPHDQALAPEAAVDGLTLALPPTASAFAGAAPVVSYDLPQVHRPPQPHQHEADHGHEHSHAAPAGGKLMTTGTKVLMALVGVGLIAAAYRFIFGLGASTNLDQQYPWGLWIAMDVGSGIALAGGGFVTAALVHIFHREHYHAIARSALLTALLGYTFYVPGLLADIGRWYNIWHPTMPSMWQVNSVLFEVGICVMLYLNVQYAELAPIVCERLETTSRATVRRMARFIRINLEKIMPVLLIFGVCLSTFHQSSLGNLMVIAPYKLHELWWTPISPILFLLSAVMVGFPMVIFTILLASWSLNRKPEMHVLAPLSRYIPVFLVLYLVLKVADVIVRGAHVHLGVLSPQSVLWTVEMLGGVVLPMVLLFRASVRHSERWLAAACLMVVLGVVLNRLNVFVLGYFPPYTDKVYVPSLAEFGLSIGLVAALLLVYRVAVTYLPILEPRPEVER